jgi:hypothetical protein
MQIQLNPNDKIKRYSLIAKPFTTSFIRAFNDTIFISQSTIGTSICRPFFRQGLSLGLLGVII